MLLVTFSYLCSVLSSGEPVDSCSRAARQYKQINTAVSNVITNRISDPEDIETLCSYISFCAQNPDADFIKVFKHFLKSYKGYNKYFTYKTMTGLAAWLNLLKYKFINYMYDAGITVVDDCPLLINGTPGK